MSNSWTSRTRGLEASANGLTASPALFNDGFRVRRLLVIKVTKKTVVYCQWLFILRAIEMIQWVKQLDASPNDLCLIPRAPKVDGES